jgi:hypothetical protein
LLAGRCGRARAAGLVRPPGLADGDRCDGRAREALRLQRLHDEGELVDLLRRQLVELQILEQVNAVHHQRELMDGPRWASVGTVQV